MLKDYHNHTFRCKHAVGDVEDYCRVAVRKGLAVLGMSDHTPFPEDKWIDVRMYYSELEGYIEAIDRARSLFPKLKILKALECEYSKEFHRFFKDELLGKYGLDYLITSAHYFPLDGEWVPVWEGANTDRGLKAYAEYVVQAMSSGIFAFSAHPDMFGISCEKWSDNVTACSRYILEAAEALKMPLEINAYGFRKPKITTTEGVRPQYPLQRFWELASEYDVTVLVNSDSHSPEDILGKTHECHRIAEKYKLKYADLSHLEKDY
jgi:histidinol-phosphatase (PHP family)